MQLVQFFGAFKIGAGPFGRCAGIGETGRECAAYLFQNKNRMFDRNDLVEKFWAFEDPVSAKSNLVSMSSRLRRTLNATRGLETELCSDKWSLGVYSRGALNSDTEELEQIYGQLTTGEGDTRAVSQRLADLYCGSFLPGHSSRWTMIERERLQSIFVRAALLVIDRLMRKGAFEEAIDNCRLVLVHDPLREAVHRRIMLIRAIKGENAKLRQHYARLQDFVMAECDAQPDDRTQTLLAGLCRGPTRSELEVLIAEELAIT